jgi:ABC-type nitrate/sulfonate/bicarbonate transport system substrate-binding protein
MASVIAVRRLKTINLPGGHAMSRLAKFCAAICAAVAMLAPEASSAKMRLAWQTGDIQIQLSYALGTQAFEKAGLDLDLKTFASGPAILPALASQEIDVAFMGDFPTVTGFANGLPLSIIMLQNVARTSTRIVATPQSGVKTLADLKGKRIGVSVGSTSHGHILKALNLASLAQSDVTLVNLAPANMPSAYFAGQIDVAVIWEPNVGEIEAAGGVRIATSESLGLIAASVAVVRTDYLKDHGDDVAKFLKIWDDARVAFLKDHDGVARYEAKRLNMSTEQFNQLLGRTGMVFPSYPEQLTADYLGAPGKQEAGKFYQHISGTAQLLLEIGRIKAIPASLVSLIDIEPMSRIDAKARKE